MRIQMRNNKQTRQSVSEKKSQSEKRKTRRDCRNNRLYSKDGHFEGPKRPALLVSQAWFHQTKSKKPIPGPARLEIWRQDDKGTWEKTTVEDPDSNVFHKAIPYEDGILTIGAEKAILKKWTFDTASQIVEARCFMGTCLEGKNLIDCETLKLVMWTMMEKMNW